MQKSINGVKFDTVVLFDEDIDHSNKGGIFTYFKGDVAVHRQWCYWDDVNFKYEQRPDGLDSYGFDISKIYSEVHNRVTGLQKELEEIENYLNNLNDSDAFILQLRSLDWYYNYSDCGRTYKAGRESIAKFKELAKEYDLDHIFKMDHDERNEWFREQNVVKASIRKCEIIKDEYMSLVVYQDMSIVEIALLKDIKSRLEQFVRDLPKEDFGGNCFIHTPNTNDKVFREWSIEVVYKPMAVHRTVQRHVNDFFDGLSAKTKKALTKATDIGYIKVSNGDKYYNVSIFPSGDVHFDAPFDVMVVIGPDSERFHFVI